MINKINLKFKVLKNLDWKWARKYYFKKLRHLRLFYFSKLICRRYWEVDVEGVKIKLGFSHPYHHSIARNFALTINKDERINLSLWKERAENCGEGLILDLGAYNGIYGLLAAKVNPKANVIIVEPETVNVNHIIRNVELNNLKNVLVLQKAVSGRGGKVSFNLRGGSTAGQISKKGSEIESITLKELAADSNVKLIKCDICSSEVSSFLAAKELLSKAPNLGILLDFYFKDNQEKQKEFWGMFKELGYKIVYLYLRNDGGARYYWIFK